MSTFEYVVWERSRDDQIEGVLAICRERDHVVGFVTEYVDWLFRPDLDDAAGDAKRSSQVISDKRTVKEDFMRTLRQEAVHWTPSLYVRLDHKLLDRLIVVQAAAVIE